MAADGSGSSLLTTIDRSRKEQLHGWPQVLEDGSILLGVQTEERRRVARFFPKGERLEYLPIDAEPPAFYLPATSATTSGPSRPRASSPISSPEAAAAVS